MLFGAHVSIAGGLAEAPKNAAAIGCEVFQMFSRSPRGGPAPAITLEGARTFRDACDRHQQQAWYIHTPYYINLASERTTIRSVSIRIIREELERGSQLGAAFVMTHLGSAKDMGKDRALPIVAAGLAKALEGYTGTTVLLLEISAGAGQVIGDTFQELADLLKRLDYQAGICYDTQHGFASGYDIRTPAAVDATLTAFDDTIGLEHLKLSHCNDSKVAFGDRKDRHEHIGKGAIGEKGFKALITDSRMKSVNLLLETPPEGAFEDLAILKRLRAPS